MLMWCFASLGQEEGCRSTSASAQPHQRHSGLFLYIATGRIRNPKEAGS